MSQLKTGTVTLVNGSSLVVGDSSADWLTGASNAFFLADRDSVEYEISEFESPDSSSSGFWELTLVSPYKGVSRSGALYRIHQQVTQNYKFPIITKGDVGTTHLLQRAINLTDQTMNFDARASGVSGTDDTEVILSSELSVNQQIVGINLPANAVFTRALLRNNTSSEITGLKLGVTSEGDEIMSVINLLGGSNVGVVINVIQLLKHYGNPQPAVFGTSVYISANNWNSSNLDLELGYKTIGLLEELNA